MRIPLARQSHFDRPCDLGRRTFVEPLTCAAAWSNAWCNMQVGVRSLDTKALVACGQSRRWKQAPFLGWQQLSKLISPPQTNVQCLTKAKSGRFWGAPRFLGRVSFLSPGATAARGQPRADQCEDTGRCIRGIAPVRAPTSRDQFKLS